MSLYAAVLHIAAWTGTDTGYLLVCLGYLIDGAGIGIRRFGWDPR